MPYLNMPNKMLKNKSIFKLKTQKFYIAYIYSWPKS